MEIEVQRTSEELIEFDDKKLALIRNTLCKDATIEEFEVFIEICKATQLNPLFKQIYFIKRGGKPTHQTSIDGLRLIADRTKRYIPGREPTFAYDSSGNLISSTSYVKKLAHDGTWHEVAATAMFKEYNACQGLWAKMPHVMIAKCAEAAALRRAFPAQMLGLYSDDEMQQADSPTINISASQPPIEDLISESEAMGIEEFLKYQSQEYRDDLLKYYSSKLNLPMTMKDFRLLPKKYMNAVNAAFQKRISKQSEESK